MRKFNDIHVHLSEHNQAKAESALDVCVSMGCERIALQSLTYRSSAYNLWLLRLKNSYKRADLSVFGMVHNEMLYSDVPFEIQAKKLIEMGCDGIKLMDAPCSRKRIGFGPNDPRYDKMLNYLEENEIPILIHVADPEEFWDDTDVSDYRRERGWCYFKEGYLKKEELNEELFEMLEKHPRLKVIIAHFMFLSNFIDEATRIMEKYPNVSFDVTPGWEMFLGFTANYDAAREFFIKYADRIYYGTDTNNTKRHNAEIHLLVRMALERDDEFMMPTYSERIIRGLNLPCDVLDKIYYKNYDRLIPKTREVNMELVEEYARKMLSDVADSTEERDVRAREYLEKTL